MSQILQFITCLFLYFDTKGAGLSDVRIDDKIYESQLQIELFCTLVIRKNLILVLCKIALY